MNELDCWLLAVALAMDCMTVSITSGIVQKRMEWANLLLMAGLFGFFQALMPVIGWFVSKPLFAVEFPFHHWLAFAILAFLGGRMIWNSFKPESATHFSTRRLSTLLLLAVSTSIDALAIGMSFICTGMRDFSAIVYPVTVIGIVSFVLSIAGKWIGVFIGNRINWQAERLGGIILILIGVKILLDF